MEAIKYYKRYIVENKNLVFISIFISLLFRGFMYLAYTDPGVYSYSSGYLWTDTINSFLADNRDISALISVLFTAVIIFYAGYLNTRHKLIRSRTYLVYFFGALFFSSHPAYVYMGPHYIVLLLFVMCTDILLSSFQQPEIAGKAYSIGFFLALASFFIPAALFYMPLFWVGFRIMRSFNAKAILTSILGVVSVYWIAFFYYLWQKDLDSFLRPVYELYPFFSDYLQNISISAVLIIVFCTAMIIIAMISYFNNSYKDKIQTRANLYFLFMTAGFSLLFFLVINNSHTINLYIWAFASCLLLSHFFSLILEKWKVSLFYSSVTLYIIICIYFLFSNTIIDLLTV